MAETTRNGVVIGTKAGEASRYTDEGTSSLVQVVNLTNPAFEANYGRLNRQQQEFFQKSLGDRIGGKRRVRRYAYGAEEHSHDWTVQSRHPLIAYGPGGATDFRRYF